MATVEERLRELARHASIPNDDRLPDVTASRIKRRRRMSAATALLALCLSGIAAGAVLVDVSTPRSAPHPVGAPRPGSAGSTEAEPDGNGSVRVPLEGFGAVWPEDTADETSSACAGAGAGSFRADATLTALRFGETLLGWEDAEATVTGTFGNSKQIEMRRDSSGDSPSVSLSMVEYADRCWSVQSVAQEDGQRTDVVADRRVVEGGRNIVTITFAHPGSGTVELGYGDRAETKRFTAPGGERSVTFSFPPIRPRDAGHYLILFEGEDGKIVGATGAPLPSARLRD